MSLRQRWSQVSVGLMMVLYLAYFGWFTLRAYDTFVYQAHDLGIYDQAVWNTLHGQPFRSTLEEPYDSLLGDHFEPILLLIAPIYALWPSPKTLLLIQTAALTLGALPVYLLAKDRLRPKPAGAQTDSRALLVEVSALGFAGVYLLYPAVHSANVFEFHPSALAISLLLYTIYFLRKRRFAAYFVFLVLSMGTKEVLPLTTLALGLYALVFEKKRMVGLATIAASALWFGLAVFIIIPHFSPEGQSQYFAEYYGWLGGSAGEVVANLLTHPGLGWERLTRQDSLLYMHRLLLPAGYVSLLGLPTLLVAAPALLLNVLSDFSFQHNALNFFQYAAAIAPFVVVAAIDGTAFLAHGLRSLWERFHQQAGSTEFWGSWVAAAVVALSLVTSLATQRDHGYLPFSRDFYLAPRDEKAASVEALVQQVPPQASVSTDRIPGPHLSQRPNLYLYPSMHNAKYVIVDTSYRDSPFPPRDRYAAIQSLLDNGGYDVVDGRFGYLLLKQGGDLQGIPDQFYSFWKAGEPSPQVKMDLVFGEELRLLGFDLVWERPVRPHAHLVLYWQAQRPIERDLRLYFVQTDSAGQLLPGSELEFDASVWYPTSRWQTTEVVRTETLHWSAEDTQRFGVAVGVVEGPGFWDLEKRVGPEVHAAPWPMPGVHDGSLIWLVTLETDGRLVTMDRPGEQP